MKQIKNSFGFTLIELLVAVAIMSFIMVQVTLSTSQILDAKSGVEKREEMFQIARVSLQKLEQDLHLAFLSSPPKPKRGRKTLSASSGFRQEGAWKTFFIASDSGSQDSIKFTSLAYMRRFENQPASDQMKVEYRIESNDEGGSSLIRVEVPWLDGSVEVEGRSFVLVPEIETFNLEYYDHRQDEWVNEWNTEQTGWSGKLPWAVRITLSIPDPDDEEETIAFSTGVSLALSESAPKI